MANITQLASTFNLTRQGLYKIARNKSVNLSELDESTATDLIKEHLANKSKNNNYIAKGLNISVTKLNRLIEKYGIDYASFKNADEIIDAIKENAQREQQEKREQIEQRQILKVMRSAERQLSNALISNNTAWLKTERKLTKNKYRNVKESLKEYMAFLNSQQKFLLKELEELREDMESVSQGNLKAYKTKLETLYTQHRQEPKN